MLVRSKFFSQFVEKIEKLKLSLSKQHNKMQKVRSEMLKIRKKWQNNHARENYPGNIPRNFSNSGNPEDFLIPGFPGKFFENFPFPKKLKIRGKEKSWVGASASGAVD